MEQIMNKIERDIKEFTPQKGQVAIYWLGGAGFIIKTGQSTIGVDLYLSDAVRSGDDYKRLTLPPVAPGGLALDLLIASHEHGDHLDTGSIYELVGENTTLIGPDSVAELALKLGIAPRNIKAFNRGDIYNNHEYTIRAVAADHGDLSPLAIGFIMNVDGINIYFTGDTCFRIDLDELIDLKESIDILLVPINPAYGNPGAKGAANIASLMGAKTVIPCHYWQFKEHGGDPGEFLKSCIRISPKSDPKILAMGERFVYNRVSS